MFYHMLIIINKINVIVTILYPFIYNIILYFMTTCQYSNDRVKIDYINYFLLS